MAATVLSGVSAALKNLYPKGEMPDAINDQVVLHNKLSKQEDFVGESAYVAIKNANSQGIGATVATAQTADNDPSYKRFTLTRNKAFSVARIDGEAAEAAVRTEGALVDLVDDKVSGAAQTLIHDLAVWEYGAGNGIIGTISSGHGGTTLTLTSTANMNYFELGMLIVSVDGTVTALNGNKTSAAARTVTGIDRLNRTLTINSALGGTAASGDHLVRASFDCETAGDVNSVFHGLRTYVEGGSSPSSLYSLTRSTDPVRLAGQTDDYAGDAMEDAVLDALAKCTIQGIGQPDTLVANPIQVAAMQRSVGGKVVYNRDQSSKAGVGFSELVFEAPGGAVKVLSDPFCPLQVAYLLRMKDWTLWSLRKAPHMEKADGLESRVNFTDDNFEVRWKFYGAMKLTNPGCQFRLTSFGG